jgi:excisionase family DNA binding protein
MSIERLLTPHEVAELFRVNLSTVYSWVRRRRLPFQKVGPALRFSPSELSEWLSQQAHTAGMPPWPGEPTASEHVGRTALGKEAPSGTSADVDGRRKP